MSASSSAIFCAFTNPFRIKQSLHFLEKLKKKKATSLKQLFCEKDKNTYDYKFKCLFNPHDLNQLFGLSMYFLK